MSPRPMNAREHLADATRFAVRAFDEVGRSQYPSKWWWQRLRHRRHAHQMTGLAVANALIALGYTVGAGEEPVTAPPAGLDQVLAEAHTEETTR